MFFAKHICRLEPDGKQPELLTLMNKYQNVIAVFNRQGGKSTIFAIDDAHDLLFKDNPDGSVEWIIIFAPILKQAGIIFSKVLSFIQDNPITNEYVKYHNKTGYIEMWNGNKLNAETASPNADPRGYSPTKIQIDESQRVTDKMYYEAIIPSGATTGAKIQEIGTPAGRNHFYRTYNNVQVEGVRTRYKTVMQTWLQCPFISRAYVEEQMAQMPKKSFEQEFMCVWDLDEGFAWDYKRIMDALIMPPENIPPQIKTTYVAGLDVAKSPAETVLWIAMVTPQNTLQQSFMDTTSGMDWLDMMNDMIEGVMMYKPRSMCFDATGIGDPAFDYFKERIVKVGGKEWRMWAKRNLEGVVYTNAIKMEMVADVDKLLNENRFSRQTIINRYGSEMADDAVKMLHQNGLSLSRSEELKMQMTSFKRKRTETGRVKFMSEQGVNNDIPNAIMLGVRAWKNLKGTKWNLNKEKKKSFAYGGKDTTFSKSGMLRPFSSRPLPRKRPY